MYIFAQTKTNHMSNLVKIEAPELKELEESRAEQIRKTFEPMAQMLEGFESEYDALVQKSKHGIDQELTKQAKQLRLKIAKVRIESDKLHKAEKRKYLIAGRAIDGVRNILKFAVTEREDNLKEIEEYYERKKQERLEKLQKERVEALSPYVEDAEERDLSSMDQDVWDAYLAAKKKEYEDRIAAEKKAEEERLERERKEKWLRDRKDEWITERLADFADWEALTEEATQEDFEKIRRTAAQAKEKYLAEQERIRKENERLEQEREAERKKAEELEAKREKERKAAEKSAAKEKAEYERKIKEERERREKIEREEKQRREAQEQAQREAELAPDKEKLEALAEKFKAIELPSVKDQASKELIENTSKLQQKIYDYIKSNLQDL